MLECLFNNVAGLQCTTLLKKEIPAQVPSWEFWQNLEEHLLEKLPPEGCFATGISK